MPKVERQTEQFTYTLRLKLDQMDRLRKREKSTGVPVPEQIRRGIDLWLDKQGAGR